MCTLILGRDVVAPDTVLLGANRDEDPLRPSDPPGVLSRSPLVVGGRDHLAGGTWLAVRETRAAVALLNRRDRSGEPSAAIPGRRSRGLLALDVASAPEELAPHPDRRDAEPVLSGVRAVSGPGFPMVALAHALAAVAMDAYAPFSLVFASPGACWLLSHDGASAPHARPIAPGWHVITHMDLDDRNEPRTAALLDRLAGARPRSVDEAEDLVAGWLRSHGEPAGRESSFATRPPVCLHEGRIVTVSSALLWLSREGARYHHAEGRPCEHPYQDVSHLLADAPSAAESS